MRKNQSVEDIRQAIRVVQAAGIHIHGMFVFGFDGDDWETVEATVRFAKETQLTSAQLLILTPLPGSELYEQLREEGRISSRDWDLYDTHHVVFEPEGFTPYELQCAQVFGHTRLYAPAQGVKKLLTGRLVSAGLSLYAWQVNRRWQRDNQGYLRELAGDSRVAPVGWMDATRRPVAAKAG
jgi:radical SAM superfamily enzyme YgiQ (UPF0313 family)